MFKSGYVKINQLNICILNFQTSIKQASGRVKTTKNEEVKSLLMTVSARHVSDI